MSKELKYYSIGKFAGTHGLRGELVLKHALGRKSALKGLKTIFIKNADKDYFPWFVEDATIKNESETYIKLEEVNTKEDAQKLANKEVWLTEKDFSRYTDKGSSLSLLGYTIVEGKNILGIIEEVIEQPNQILCKIFIEEKEAYIPLHQESLLEINQNKKVVLVKLPEGLLDIYLT